MNRKRLMELLKTPGPIATAEDRLVNICLNAQPDRWPFQDEADAILKLYEALKAEEAKNDLA